ncbi:DspF/AvrF protein [Cedecea lapagei]|uniref:Tir chaperone n=1 Tax=Cedecea lapagei TaxID=158823 RepID=A0A3S4MFJ1_9ENTR|nr:type III secretion system chaperone [Cedecea lapagei]VEB99393.1 DspF/AvrF protein [Cedecea lapagei]
MQQQLQQWIDAWGRQQKITLRLEQGVCLLTDAQQQEAAVIELPPESSAVVLHCQVAELTGQDAALLPNLLAMNFEMNAMRGCWLALDDRNAVRLCTQCEISSLDAERFALWLSAFINQSGEVRAFIAELPAMLETR